MRASQDGNVSRVESRDQRAVWDNSNWRDFMDAMLAEIDGVQSNIWAAKRLPFPLPSYRVKLGSIGRLVSSIIEEEKLLGIITDPETEKIRKRRALSQLLGQLRVSSGVRELEYDALVKSKQMLTMEDMLQRTPPGLETPKYTVVNNYPTWEAREYDVFSVCTTEMEEEKASPGPTAVPDTGSTNKPSGAFNELAGYIFGKNQAKEKMAMTTPVISVTDKAATGSNSKKMSFVLPSRFWADDEALKMAPAPLDGSAVLLECSSLFKVDGTEESSPTVTLAVMWFGGYATTSVVKRKSEELLAAIEKSTDWQQTVRSLSIFLSK